MAKGGKRAGAGRKKNPAKELAALGEVTAARMLKELEHEKALVDLYKTCGDARLQTHILFKLREWAYGKPVQQVKVGNQQGEKFEVNVSSARDKLIALLTG